MDIISLFAFTEEISRECSPPDQRTHDGFWQGISSGGKNKQILKHGDNQRNRFPNWSQAKMCFSQRENLLSFCEQQHKACQDKRRWTRETVQFFRMQRTHPVTLRRRYHSTGSDGNETPAIKRTNINFLHARNKGESTLWLHQINEKETCIFLS